MRHLLLLIPGTISVLLAPVTALASPRVTIPDYLVSVRLSPRTADLWEYDLYRVTPGGRVRLTEDPGPEGEPDVDAVHGRLAFVAASEGRFGVFSMNIDGTGRRRHAAGTREAGHAVYEPGGRRLLYPADWGEGRYILSLEDLGSGTIEKWDTGPGSAWAPEWLPDGSGVIFVSDRHAQGEDPGGPRRATPFLYRYDCATAKVSRLTRGSRPEPYAAVAPDGRTVVFSRRMDAGSAHLVRIDLESGAEAILEGGPGLHLQPELHPDGRTLLFVSSRGGRFQVWMRDLVSGEVTPLGGDAGSEQSPRVIPGARALK
jgi:TolB protein